MDQKQLEVILFVKDTKEAYAGFKELEARCEQSDELYGYFDLYLEALHSPNSCARGRGFKMIARNARWDQQGRIDANLELILSVLDDQKAPVVRQCLPLLKYFGEEKQELLPAVKNKLDSLDLGGYKESMQKLIKKDIEKVLPYLTEQGE